MGTTAVGRPERKRSRKTKVSIVDKYLRAEAIVVGRHKTPPVPWATLAKQQGISVRWAHILYDDFAYASEDAAGRSPGKLIDDTLRLYKLTLREFLEIAEEAREAGQFAPAVGALRSALEASTADLALRRATGRLPMDLAGMSAGDDARAMFDAMVDVLKDADLSPETIAQLERIASGGRALPRSIEGSADDVV